MSFPYRSLHKIFRRTAKKYENMKYEKYFICCIIDSFMALAWDA